MALVFFSILKHKTTRKIRGGAGERGNPSQGLKAGTYFSIKQMKQGGLLLRLDKGLIHKTADQMSIHLTYRFKLLGRQFGSSNTKKIIKMERERFYLEILSINNTFRNVFTKINDFNNVFLFVSKYNYNIDVDFSILNLIKKYDEETFLFKIENLNKEKIIILEKLFIEFQHFCFFSKLKININESLLILMNDEVKYKIYKGLENNILWFEFESDFNLFRDLQLKKTNVM